LQEFSPLQDDEAVLQALVPLQEFTPAHLTRSSADAPATTAPAANKAAAEAMTKWLLVIFGLLDGRAILPPVAQAEKSELGEES
jgi:hypothetical protein